MRSPRAAGWDPGRRARTGLPVALALLLATSATALARAPSKRASMQRDRGRAELALDRAEALRAGRGVRTGHELTAALQDLAARAPALSAPLQREADRLLLRPTDGGAAPDAYIVAEATPYCTANFCV